GLRDAVAAPVAGEDRHRSRGARRVPLLHALRRRPRGPCGGDGRPRPVRGRRPQHRRRLTLARPPLYEFGTLVRRRPRTSVPNSYRGGAVSLWTTGAPDSAVLYGDVMPRGKHAVGWKAVVAMSAALLLAGCAGPAAPAVKSA